MSIIYCTENEDLIDTDFPSECEDCSRTECAYCLFDEGVEIGELVECEICHREIPSTDAYAVLQSTYVCDPKIDERCLGTWNNENHVRGE